MSMTEKQLIALQEEVARIRAREQDDCEVCAARRKAISEGADLRPFCDRHSKREV